MTTPTDTLAYSYDATGIRRSQTENGVTTHYVVDPSRAHAQVLREVVNGTDQARYTHGHRLISQQRGNDVHVHHQDALGSTRALTDPSGSVTDTYAYTYTAYGELKHRTGSTANPYRFTGEQFGEALGQYYLRARYYDPAVGRFGAMDTYPGPHPSGLAITDSTYA